MDSMGRAKTAGALEEDKVFRRLRDFTAGAGADAAVGTEAPTLYY
jgi:hypothetical protein